MQINNIQLQKCNIIVNFINILFYNQENEI